MIVGVAVDHVFDFFVAERLEQDFLGHRVNHFVAPHRLYGVNARQLEHEARVARRAAGVEPEDRRGGRRASPRSLPCRFHLRDRFLDVLGGVVGDSGLHPHRELGLDVDAFNTDGNTALHGAALRGADRVVRFLAEHHATLDLPNRRRETPLDVALILSELKRHGNRFMTGPFTTPPFYDTTSDLNLNPQDALLVLRALVLGAEGETDAEGEGAFGRYRGSWWLR